MKRTSMALSGLMWAMSLAVSARAEEKSPQKQPSIDGRSFLSLTIWFTDDPQHKRALFVENPYILNSEVGRLGFTTYRDQEIASSRHADFSRREFQQLMKDLTASFFLDLATSAKPADSPAKTLVWAELTLGVKKQAITYYFHQQEGAPDFAARTKTIAGLGRLISRKFPPLPLP